jgi:hypothetical protein
MALTQTDTIFTGKQVTHISDFHVLLPTSSISVCSVTVSLLEIQQYNTVILSTEPEQLRVTHINANNLKPMYNLTILFAHFSLTASKL